MKPAHYRLLLSLSVFANVALLLVHFTARRGPPRQPVETPPPAFGASGMQQPRTQGIPASQISHPAGFNWAWLESTNYLEYIARLRAIHCPEQTIRDIIISEINKLFAPRLRALGKPGKVFGWGHLGEDRNVRRDNELRQIAKEKRDLLRQLLGSDVEDEMAELSGIMDYHAALLSFLPPEKRSQVVDIENAYQQFEQSHWWKTRGFVLPEDQEAEARIRADMREELAKVLTPAEIKEYELRRSALSRDVHAGLETMDLSDDEFKGVYEARRAFAEATASTGGGMPAGDEQGLRAYQEAEKKRDQQLQAALSSDRYREYQRLQDPESAQVVKFAKRFSISPERLEDLFALKQTLLEQARNISTEVRTGGISSSSALSALQAQADLRLKEILGENLARTLSENSSGMGWNGINTLLQSGSVPPP